MKLLVNIDQKASILAGINAPHSTETFDLDPARLTPELRAFVSEFIDLRTGEICASVRTSERSWSTANGDWDAKLTISKPITPETVAAGLESLRAAWLDAKSKAAEIQAKKQAIAKAKAEAIRGQALAALRDRKTSTCNHHVAGYGYVWYQSPDWPYDTQADVLESPAALAWISECVAKKQAAIEDASQAAAAKAAAAKAAIDRRRTELQAAVRRLGTPTQIGRMERGLMDIEREGKALLHSEAFEPLAAAGLVPYDVITAAEVRREAESCEADGYYADVNCSFNSYPEKEITDDEFNQITAIEKALPGAKAVVHEHVGFLDGHSGPDDPDVRRRSIDVSLTAGEITLTQSYQIS